MHIIIAGCGRVGSELARLLSNEGHDVIIIDKNKLEINGDEVVYTGKVEVSEGSKFKLQVLDELQTYFKEIKLILEEQNEPSLKLLN